MLSKPQFHTGDKIVFVEDSRSGKVRASAGTVASVIRQAGGRILVALSSGREMRIRSERIMLENPPNVFTRLIDAMKARIRRLAGPLSAEEVEWVVNDIGELGVRIGGRSFYLYKGHSLVYNDFHDDGSPMLERLVAKREFGEVCHPPHLSDTPSDAERWYTEGEGWKQINPA